jgi:hypothetical protein
MFLPAIHDGMPTLKKAKSHRFEAMRLLLLLPSGAMHYIWLAMILPVG